MSTYQSKEPGHNAKLYWAIGIVIAVLVAALLIWHTFFYDTGKDVAATVGEQEFTTTEVTYYYNTVANSFLSQAQQYSAMGLDMGYDTSKSPAEQTYNEEEGTTYADYFLDSALTQLQQTAILCQQAEAEGYTLSADGQQAVEENLDLLYTYSVQQGAGSEDAYLKMVYGRNMTKGIFKDLLTQSILAEEYQQHKTDSFTYDQAKLDEYYAENAADLDSYDYRYCYINLVTEEKTDEEGNAVEPTEEETAAAMAEAKTKADEMIAKVQAGTAFNEAAKDYLDETSAASYDDPEYNHNSDELGQSLTSTYKEWLQGDRTQGDITAIEVEGTGYCVVQFLGREKAEDSYQTRTFRNILVLAETTEGEDGAAAPTEEQLQAAKDQAQALLDQWKEGEATEEAFGELAKANSADENSKAEGGLYEQASRTSLDTGVADWLFDTQRQEGDAEVVEYTDSTGAVTGYQVVYAGAPGEVRWVYQARTALAGEDYTAWFDGVKEDYPAELTDAGKEIPNLG